jgi:NH3-dependent NAD+ synthetase
MKKVFEALVEGIRSSLSACGFNSALLGLSGGLDSALVATLAKEALGKENVWAYLCQASTLHQKAWKTPKNYLKTSEYAMTYCRSRIAFNS